MNNESAFLVGEWRVEPARNLLVGPGGEERLTPRTMAVLLCLVEHAGQVVSRDDFSERVWSPAVVTDDALTRCISELRRAFGDSSSRPRFVETIPKRGYRLIAPVELTVQQAESIPAQQPSPGGKGRIRRPAGWAILVFVLVTVSAAIWWSGAGDGGGQGGFDDQTGIAVMPFRTIGPEPSVPLAEGMHYDLLSRLSALPELRVIASDAVARYRDGDWASGEVASALDVDWILAGTVQGEGERVQVNAQLIEAASESHLWARTYRRDLDPGNLFALQGEMIEDIARSLAEQFGGGRDETDPERAPTQNLEAYTLFTRARTMLARRSAIDMQQAVELFESAIGFDPDYAIARAALADAVILMAWYDYGDREALLGRARAEAELALEADPELARPRVVLGLYRLMAERDLPGALEQLERAREKNPVFIGWLGYVQAVAGSLDQAILLARESLRSSPRTPGFEYTLGLFEYFDGNLERALELARSARTHSPAYVHAHLLEGWILLAQGAPEAAAAAIGRGVELSTGAPTPELETALAIARQRAGQPVDMMALEWRLREAEAWFDLALIEWEQGRRDDAFDTISKVDWTDIETLHARHSPLLSDLRRHPRFGAVLERINESWGIQG